MNNWASTNINSSHVNFFMFNYNTIIGKFCAMISPKSLEMASEMDIYDSQVHIFRSNKEIKENL